MPTLLSERISAIQAKFQCSKADIARIAGVKPPSVSNWLDGKTMSLKTAPALRLSRHFKLNMPWLTTGVGPMYAADVAEPQGTGRVAANCAEVSLLEDFRKTPAFVRPLLLSLIEAFASLGVDCRSTDRYGKAESIAIGKSLSRLVEASISLRQGAKNSAPLCARMRKAGGVPGHD